MEVEEFDSLADREARRRPEPHCVYLLYCSPGWNVIPDTWHKDVAAALHQANFEFGLLPLHEFAPLE